MSAPANPLKLGILVFDEVEVLDYCGPFEVFSVAGSLCKETFDKVMLIADKKQIFTRGGMKIVVDHVIGEGELPNLDILLVPGGYGTRALSKDEKVLSWIKKIDPSLKYILSVCTGSLILGICGLVDNMTITTHHTCYDFVGAGAPKARMCTCRRFTDNGRVLTSAGISAGIDLSLYFVKKLFGTEVTDKVVDHMEYNWVEKELGKCTCGADK